MSSESVSDSSPAGSLDHGESTAIMISAQNQGDFVRHLLLGHRMTLKWQYLGSLCFYDALSVSFDRWELHQPLIPFVAQNREHVELMTFNSPVTMKQPAAVLLYLV